MRLRFFSTSITATVLALLSANVAAQLAEKPFGLEQRTPWTTSRLRGSPEPPPEYRLTRAFPQISFKGPVFIAQDPLSDRLLVAEYEGRIYEFPAERSNRQERSVPRHGPRHLGIFFSSEVQRERIRLRLQSRGHEAPFPHTAKEPGVALSVGAGSNPPRLRPESARRSSSSGLPVDTMAEKRLSGRMDTSIFQLGMVPAVPM